MAGYWHSEPPDPRATHVTEAEALAKARGGHADAPVFSMLVPYRDVAAANAALAANATVHPDRMVWVVTVHADVMTAPSFGVRPQLKHMYSVIIDGQLVVVPTQRGADLSHDPRAGPQAPRHG